MESKPTGVTGISKNTGKQTESKNKPEQVLSVTINSFSEYVLINLIFGEGLSVAQIILTEKGNYYT